MRLCIAVCALWLTSIAVANADDQFKILCFFASWAVNYPGNGNFDISEMDASLCTHMIYAFVGITEEGEINILDEATDLSENGGYGGFEKFNALRKSSPKTKTLVSIGGWNEGSTNYSIVVNNETLRSNFATNVVNFLCEHGFDGFDIDWEYPNQRGGVESDLENFALLLKDLRSRFDERNFILSITVPAAESSASLSYDIPLISDYPHLINIMDYDFHGSWDTTTGHNTPLYAAERETTESERSLNINASSNYWLSQGAPLDKITIGTAFYGKSFTLANSSNNVPGSLISGGGTAGPYTQESGVLNYNEICEKFLNETWTVVFDEEQRVPYAHYGDQWVSYDNVESITEKANYIKSNGFAGTMIWNIAGDDFRGICGDKFPLLNALNDVLC